jgi:hypothetical protein
MLGEGKRFFSAEPSLRPTQQPETLSSCVQGLGREADQSLPSTDEVNACSSAATARYVLRVFQERQSNFRITPHELQTTEVWEDPCN